MSNNSISEQIIIRLARKAGIIYLPKSTYGIIKKGIYDKLQDIINNLDKIVKNREGTTITLEDLELLYLMNHHLYKEAFGHNEKLWCDGHISQCVDNMTICGRKKINEYSSKNINTSNFIIPHTIIKNYIKFYYLSKLHVRKNVFKNIHLYLENYIHHVLIKSNMIHKENKIQITNVLESLLNTNNN